MNESKGAKTLGRTEIDWRERKLRGQIWKNSSCSLMFFWSLEENLDLRDMFPLQCSIESVWTGGSRPLKKRHIRTKWGENMQKMQVACLQTLSHLMKDLTVLVCCHRHSMSSLRCSTRRRAGDTPRSYKTLHLVCRNLLPFLKRQPKLQSQSEHESFAAPKSRWMWVGSHSGVINIRKKEKTLGQDLWHELEQQFKPPCFWWAWFDKLLVAWPTFSNWPLLLEFRDPCWGSVRRSESQSGVSSWSCHGVILCEEKRCTRNC